jgi:hypothetical protein
MAIDFPSPRAQAAPVGPLPESEGNSDRALSGDPLQNRNLLERNNNLRTLNLEPGTRSAAPLRSRFLLRECD